MLSDHELPLDDPIVELPPGPKLVVVYRTRGIPWLLVPPLLLLAGVAAIVVYRRSERPQTWPSLVTRGATESLSKPHEPAATLAPVDGTKIDALAELAELTARPVALSPPPASPAPPRFDQTPPRAVAETETSATKEVSPPPPRASPEPKPAPLPQPVADAAPKPESPPVFDPIVIASDKPQAAPAPAPVDPGRRDPVGFDPDSKRVVLDAAPKPDPPADRPAENPAQEAVAPAAEPLALDPRPAKPAVDAQRAQRTREAQQDIQAEAERRLATRMHLEEIMPDLLNVDPSEGRRRREDFATMVRRLAAQDRPAFHAQIRQALKDFGWGAGPEIQGIRDRFGVDSVPEIAVPANRDLSTTAARLTTTERIARMRRWGLPEGMILDDLYEYQRQNVRGRDGARTADEAWVFAARVLISHPPPAPRAPSLLAAPTTTR